MAENRESFLLLLCSILFIIAPLAHGWGKDGHFIICRIAQARLSEKTAAAVNDLLPDYAQNDLASLCLWADHVKFRRRAPGLTLESAVIVCLSSSFSFISLSGYGFVQPLHVGFTTDKGGNTIDVKWFTRKTVLHHVWDDSLIETAVERFYGSDVESLLNAIQSNITGAWAGRIDGWEKCSPGVTACPDGYIYHHSHIYNITLYASESITAACNFAYKDVDEGSVLEDDYFLSRLPTVYLRLAEAGVRLAATLNRALG
ncbi:Endonuclease 2 [Nymphaea thermarum]|nr:Endonuclease 2 [Nymphaea thermarum]